MAHRGAVVVAVVIAEHCYDVRVSLQAHKRRRNQPRCVLAPMRRHHGCTAIVGVGRARAVELSTSSGGVLGSNPHPNHDPDPQPNVRLGLLALGCLCVTHSNGAHPEPSPPAPPPPKKRAWRAVW